MAKRSPQAIALTTLAADGWIPWVVERNLTPIIKKDLFGCIDILALKEGEVLAIQVTSAANHSARVKKVSESPYLADMLACGWTVAVWSYKGEKLRIEQVDLT